jgi:hypothetical protein
LPTEVPGIGYIFKMETPAWDISVSGVGNIYYITSARVL